MGRKLGYCSPARAAVLLGLLLFLAGCAADSGTTHSNDNDKNSGFYTGLTGGGAQP